ncbi:cysteine desulfurase IscS [Planctomycetia bacterium]|nr:cysteine desulfurase IscS [Planctomycetia bacterium]
MAAADRPATIYLDNHATTRLDPRVLEEMLPWLTDRYGNAGSATHEMGREARAAVEGAREEFAATIGATAREIVFTSGATESANLAILGTAARAESSGRAAGHVVTLLTEHHAVLDPLDHLERMGAAVTRLPVGRQDAPADAAGRISLATLEETLRPETFLVSVLLANNEIGVVQDVAAIAAVVHDRGALLHVDCAQALGRMPLDVDAIDADLASFSAHKCHGPKGVGALYVRRRGRAVRVAPLVFGGGQERGMRSGTLDVPGIVGLAAAARLARDEGPADAARMRVLRDRLWEGLAARVPGLALNGPALDAVNAAGRPLRLVNNLNVRVPGVDGQTLLATLADAGLALSSGSACSSESPRPSHVLLALGLDDDEARASLRFGLSRFTTATEIDTAVERIAAGVERLRAL